MILRMNEIDLSGERVSNAWAICLKEGDNSWKRLLIPHKPTLPHGRVRKDFIALRWARVWLASWWGNGLPRQRSVAGLRGWSATLGLRHGPDSYGRQQWGILHNGGNPDAATPREGRRYSYCKPLSSGTIMTVPEEEAPANYVPAAAVKRRVLALSGITGCKGSAGGPLSWKLNLRAQPVFAFKTEGLEWSRGRRNFRCSGGMRRYRKEHQWRRRPTGLLLTLRLESMGSKQD